MAINSAHAAPQRLQLLTIGFCTDLAGEAKLKAKGVERIWRRGNGLESIDDAIYEFRGRAGTLAVTDDLRIFGGSNIEIAMVCARLFRMGISLIDADHLEQVVPELQERARAALHAARPMPSHRVARRRGRQGGLAKAAAAAFARGIRCADDIVQRLCDHPALTWDDCAAILGPPFSKSTLQRICQR